ncbi:hypothetical protein AERO9A_250216 [Aeromonas salmonicida]|nr:hypothetical protein AERO9A_250216 [Aeromonas salmonicida]
MMLLEIAGGFFVKLNKAREADGFTSQFVVTRYMTVLTRTHCSSHQVNPHIRLLRRMAG